MNLDDLVKEAPQLTLEMPTEPQAPAVAEQDAPPAEAAPEITLTEEERKMVDNFAQQIDITNTQQVLQYGAACQKKIADFSETALNSVKTKDLGEVGQMLTDVVGQLKEFDDDDSKGFFGMFKKSGNKLSAMKAKYDKAETNINKI
ncbi:MAG: toxic anion resistance protein, partial [Lachnospiraceae bacterium]|nr:toxic anion resistance protein [Lachnospiraceae bacterium]